MSEHSEYIKRLNERVAKMETHLQGMRELEPVTHKTRADYMLAESVLKSAIRRDREFIKQVAG